MAARRGRGANANRNRFNAAIQAAECLTLVQGLGAVERGEGRGRIVANGATLLGSVHIDHACKDHPDFAQSCRWDYVIGVERPAGDVAYFVEVHSADTSGVSEVRKKLDWLLREYLERDPQKALKALLREVHRVASGRVNIPKHVPEYRQIQTTLRARGLRGPSERLVLR
jgi:hypothetical protein